MKILNGKVIAQKRQLVLRDKIAHHVRTGHRSPRLVVILVGDNKASEIYVKHKMVAAQEVGIKAEIRRFHFSVPPDTLYKEIQKLNKDESIDGILIQLPLPENFRAEDYLQAVDARKDVDGFHYKNQGRLLEGHRTIVPATPLGVMNLLKAYDIDVRGKHVVMIGTSNIVGKPLGILLLNAGATVTFTNRNTKNLPRFTKTADILVSATGNQFIVTKNMVKSKAVVIDIGIVRHPQTKKLVGDVDFDQVAPLTTAITPVPGGVGPMTIVSLLENTYQLYRKHLNLKD